jgi:hypothetical protein
MSWTCPECGREFRNAGQVHTCETFDVDLHFQKNRAVLRPVFDSLVEFIDQLGAVDTRVLRSEIVFAAGATFAGVKVRGASVELLLYLDHIDDEPPVERVHDVSRNRVIHQILLKSTEEITDRVRFLLNQAYCLVSGRS